MTFVSVLLGGWLGPKSLTEPLLLAGLSAALITGGGNVLNDICDLSADRINTPHRPLPSGALTVTAAAVETLLLFLSGLLISLVLPSPTAWIALAACLGLIAYNTRLKHIPFAGNLMVSLLCGLAFIFGGVAVHSPGSAIIPALFATVYHLGREILKDLADVKGDQHLPGTTLPLKWGNQKSKIWISAIYLFLILSTPLPVFYGYYGYRYLALVSLLSCLLAYVLLSLWRDTGTRNLRLLNRLLKAGMLVGLASIFVDSL